MSAFGNRIKDEVVDAIENLFQDEAENGKSVPDILESVMEAVTYGIRSGTWTYFNTDKPASPAKEGGE